MHRASHHTLTARFLAMVCLIGCLLSSALAGRFYALCSMDSAVHFSPCCEAGTRDEAPALDERACCTFEPFATLSVADPRSDSGDIHVAPPGVVVLPPSTSNAGTSVAPRSPVSALPSEARRSRARPARPRALRERLSAISVLRC